MKDIQDIQNYLEQHFQLSEEQVLRLLPGFISTLSTHMENLKVALSSGDKDSLGQAGHTIKGAFLNVTLFF